MLCYYYIINVKVAILIFKGRIDSKTQYGILGNYIIKLFL